MAISKRAVLGLLACLLTVVGCSDDGTDSSELSSNSPYSSVRAALDICASRLKSDVANGKYNHLSDTRMYREMEDDQESCMAGYGHYPK